ncbi:MAG: putative sulfate exporter family transporter [Andreesenia angusta]|nr:putative sulfate exporter family transporter [Andreesenia angusta]
MDYSIFKTKSFWIAIFVTLLASIIGKYASKLPGLNIIGAMVIALLIGMIYQLNRNIVDSAWRGTGFISNKFLRLGIILLGFKLNLKTLAESGIKTISLAIVVVLIMIFGIYLIARKLKVDSELAILASCGCGICGAAAVMGVSPQIKAKTEDSVLAVAVVCILGTFFTLLEVALRPFLGLTDVQFGVMAGASLHEIAHAVAAGGSAGSTSLDIAIITKLSRVLLLAPVAFIVGLYYQKKNNKDIYDKAKLPIPWFMVGFLLTSAIGTFANFSENLLANLTSSAYIFLGMAMAALGMSVNFKVIVEKGKNIFISATIMSFVLFCFTYFASRIFF